MPFPRFVAKANRYVTNPVLSRLAGRVSVFAMLEHVGRRSGKLRKIPIMAFHEPDGFVIALTYGPKADWVLNVLAANQCAITIRGQRHELVSANLINVDPASLDLPAPVKFFLHRLRVRDFLRLRETPEKLPDAKM